jgi:hypothetical protein
MIAFELYEAVFTTTTSCTTSSSLQWTSASDRSTKRSCQTCMGSEGDELQDNCRTVQANVTGSMPDLYNSHLGLVCFTDLTAALEMCMDFSGAGLLTLLDLSHGTSRSFSGILTLNGREDHCTGSENAICLLEDLLYLLFGSCSRRFQIVSSSMARVRMMLVSIPAPLNISGQDITHISSNFHGVGILVTML